MLSSISTILVKVQINGGVILLDGHSYHRYVLEEPNRIGFFLIREIGSYSTVHTVYIFGVMRCSKLFITFYVQYRLLFSDSCTKLFFNYSCYQVDLPWCYVSKNLSIRFGIVQILVSVNGQIL